MWSAHAVYLCSELFSRSFPFQPGPAWAGRSKTSVQVTTPVYVNCRYYTSNWSSWLEWGCFPHVLWRNLLDVWFLVHFTINAFMFDFELLEAKFHCLQKRQENAITSSKTCVAWFTLIVKKENCPEGALDWNVAQLSFGTTMYSGLEHRKTRLVFSYPSKMTSKYS